MMIYRGTVLANEYDVKALDEIILTPKTAAVIKNDKQVAEAVFNQYTAMNGALNTYLDESIAEDVRDAMGEIWISHVNTFIYMVNELHYWELARHDLKQYDIYCSIANELARDMDNDDLADYNKQIPALSKRNK